MTNDTASGPVPDGAAKERPQKTPLPFWRKIALAFVIAAMAGVAGLMLTAYMAEYMFCGEIRKISKAGEPLKLSDLSAFGETSPRGGSGGQAPTPTGEDANDYYLAALRQMRPADVTNITQVDLFYKTDMATLPANQFPSDLREKVAESLKRAEPMLDNLDKGARLNLSNFDMGVFQGSQVCKSHLDSAQVAVSLLSLRTLDLILAGKSDAAADSIISTLKLVRVFDSCPTMLVQRWKMVCVGIVCGDIRLLLERCSPSDDRLNRLQSLLAEIFPSDSLKKSLLAERVYQLEIARNLMPKDVASQYLAGAISDLPERAKMPAFTWHRMRVFFASAKYMRDMAWLIKVSNQPWPGPLDEITNTKSKSGNLILAASLLSRLNAETLAATRCTSEAIAIERYRRQEGRLPDSLADTSPKYIAAIPIDPFTGRSLLYIHDDRSYTVYSTGINRVDDKGAITGKADQPVPLDEGISIKRDAK